MTNTKSIFKSRTIWANIIAGALMLVAQQADVLDADFAAMLIAGLNIAMRFVTKQPIHIIKKQQ